MKTQEEIEQLKRSWIHDGCWDIEHTEGFEAHHDELKAWRKNYEAEQDAKREKKIQEDMQRLGITCRGTYNEFQNLHFQIERLEQRIERLEDR